MNPPVGARPSKGMANWLIAPLRFLIGVVRRSLMLRNARHISLNTTSSFGNSDRFFVTFRNVMFSDSIVLVVQMARSIAAG